MSTPWRIVLWTSATPRPPDDGRTFGCASHGLAAPDSWIDPATAAQAAWPAPVTGTVLAGTCAGVLEQLAAPRPRPRAAVLFFAQAAGVEAFLEACRRLLPGVPLAGGGAALAPGRTRGEILPAAEDVALLLLDAGDWRVDTLNCHEPLGAELAVEHGGPRTLRRVAGEPALAFLRREQATHGFAQDDFASLAFQDAEGRNLHSSPDGNGLRLGADLPADGRLRLGTSSRARVTRQLAAFCQEPQSLIFGCAGLRGLLNAPVIPGPGALAGFLFGEVVTPARHPRFGNLMAAKLAPHPPP